MTKNLILLFGLFSTSAFAQLTLPTNGAGQVQYQEIIRIGDGKLPARPVYDQIRAWAGTYYTGENEGERQYDPQHGILFVRSLYSPNKQSIRYTLTVEARIGRYRATITDLINEEGNLMLPVRATSTTADEMIQAAGGTVDNPKIIEQVAAKQAELYKQLDAACRATLANLKAHMTATQTGNR